MPVRKEKEKKGEGGAEGFEISYYYWSFSRYIMAAKGLNLINKFGCLPLTEKNSVVCLYRRRFGCLPSSKTWWDRRKFSCLSLAEKKSGCVSLTEENSVVCL